MRRLTLIRHGLTTWNAEGRFQGHSDVPLAPRGRAQAERLREQAARLEPIDVILSSPSVRAAETAEIAFPGHRLLRDERLRELDFGVFEGRTFAQNEAHPAWSWWAADPFGRPAPRGESYRALQARAIALLDEAAGRWQGADVVAVCHSGTIQMLLAHMLGVDRPRWRVRLEVDHTSVSQVRFEDGFTIVECVNDVAHLAGEVTR